MSDINVVEPNGTYDFKNIGIGALNRISGETFYARIFSNNKPLFIQTPKSLLKQGFVKTGKKMYCDLMFTNQDEIFVNWIENLETTCQQLIYAKKTDWFSSEENMELNDIESAFTSLIKLYKSGKYYLMRANVKTNAKIYDESGVQIAIEEVRSDANMITVVEIQGIKFVSKTFQIELEIKQCMIVSTDPFSEGCFIKHTLAKPVVEKLVVKPPVGAHVDDHNDNMVDNLIDNMVKDIIIETHVISEKQKQMTQPISIKEVKEVKDLKEHDPNNFIEDSATKLNTKMNSVTTSNVKVTPIDDEDRDDDRDGDKDGLQIGEEIVDATALGIIEIIKEPEGLKDLKEVFKEMDFNVDEGLETISLKKPNQVYYDIYKTARKKAKDIKKQAILAYLEAKNIKNTYMLDDVDDSDSDMGSNSSGESDFDSMSINESDGE